MELLVLLSYDVNVNCWKSSEILHSHFMAP